MNKHKHFFLLMASVYGGTALCVLIIEVLK